VNHLATEIHGMCAAIYRALSWIYRVFLAGYRRSLKLQPMLNRRLQVIENRSQFAFALTFSAALLGPG
jgi:hypothetical protein